VSHTVEANRPAADHVPLLTSMHMTVLLPICRKSLPLPLPVFGSLTRPVLAAEWELGSNWRRMPRLQLGLAVSDDVQSSVDDGATLSNDGTVAFRKKAFVTRRWGVEVGGMLNSWTVHGPLQLPAVLSGCVGVLLIQHSQCSTSAALLQCID
jgi:hypothetical protein